MIAGGLSNLSYAVTGGARPLVLRRPPLGHVLNTAHDMRREYRVLSALRGTAVPVPETELFHDDTDGAAGVGAPFYLMEFVPGRVLAHPADNAEYSPAALHRLSLDLAETVARVHDVDVAAVGLADFGRPEGFLGRQAARWMRQFEQSRSRPLPELEQLAVALSDSLPQTRAVSLLHGDFRLDNTLVAADERGAPRIVAVLDWEMSTIGDSLTDLGLFGLYWDLHSLEGADDSALASAIDPMAGYAPFEEIIEHYSATRGLGTVPELSWYLAFAGFKLAVILEGIHYRYGQGDTVGDGFETVGRLVAPLARRGLSHLDALR
jgi:aminoglycoside phosphotransferase (APT) family kinase protein